MDRTRTTLREQMRITEIEIERRKELIDFTDTDVERLVSCAVGIEKHIDRIVERFYAAQTAVPEIALLIGDADTLTRLREAQHRYVLELFGGRYDIDYVNQRLRIGLVHKRIGVEPKLYLSAVLTLRTVILDAIDEFVHDKVRFREVCDALDKLMTFDVTLVFDTYIRSMLAEIETARADAEVYARSLESRTRALEELSSKDPLTGLFNRRTLEASLEREIRYAERNRAPISLLYIDLNEFKAVNDERGHQEGDRILIEVAAALRDVSRSVDVPCRIGGDEFCIILPGMSDRDADAFCRRLLKTVKARSPGTRISIGVAHTGPDHYVPSELLIKHADQNLYRAKNSETDFIVKSVPKISGVVTGIRRDGSR